MLEKKQNIISEKKVFVCGGGHQGLAMAAHLALNGIKVNLWNRTENNIKKLIETKKISCNGVINGVAELEKVSSNMEDVVLDFVMVTTPSSAHKDVARQLAPYVKSDMIIILNPGRTFGAIDFANELKKCGVKDLPYIAETQTIVYTCRKFAEDGATIYALKNNVQIAALKNNDIDYIMQRMPRCLSAYFSPASSVLETSFSNVGMVLHCAPVMMNVGWIESEKVDFKYYYDGISKSVASFLQKIDNERMAVASASGCKVESVLQWLRRTYQIQGDTLYECVRNNESYREIDAPPTLSCRYILEDVPNGLVPIEYLGQELGVATPNITIIINLANAILDENFRLEGRKISVKEIDKYI